MFSFITSMVPFALKIMGFYVDKKDSNNKLQKRWLDLLESVEEELGASAEMREEAKSQRQRILEKIKIKAGD